MGSPKGIGGWLAFFIVTLILGVLINTALGINEAASGYNDPDFEGYGLLVVLLDIIFYGSLVGFCIYVIVLLFRMSPGAVFAAKLYLIAFFCMNLLISIIGILVGGSFYATIKSIMRSFIYSFAWFSYLSVSSRVRNTYRVQKRLVRDWMIFAVVMGIPLLFLIAGSVVMGLDSGGGVDEGTIEFDIPKDLEFEREIYDGVPVYYFHRPGCILVLFTVEYEGSPEEFMDDSFDDLLQRYYDDAEYDIYIDDEGVSREGYRYAERQTVIDDEDLFGVRVFERPGYVAVLSYSSWLQESEENIAIVDSISDSLVLDDW